MDCADCADIDVHGPSLSDFAFSMEFFCTGGFYLFMRMRECAIDSRLWYTGHEKICGTSEENIVESAVSTRIACPVNSEKFLYMRPTGFLMQKES